jgi:hypothetical protein
METGYVRDFYSILKRVYEKNECPKYIKVAPPKNVFYGDADSTADWCDCAEDINYYIRNGSGYFKNDSDFIYFMQRSVALKVNKKEQFTLFLGILELLFKDSLLDNLSIFENEELKLSYEKEEIEKFVYSIIMCREKIDLNANIALLIDDLCYKLRFE